MSWIERIKSNITPTRKASIPEGVWTKCDSCGQVLYRAELERNLEVCPKCDHHMRMSARNRLHSLLDEGSLVELGSELEPKDVLKFRDSKKYKDRLASAQKETGEKDALIVMKGTICRWLRRRLSSPLWAAQWALWLARASCVPLSRRWKTTAR